MKKIVKLIIIMATVAAFSACGSGGDTNKKTEQIKNIKIMTLNQSMIKKSNISSGILEPLNEVPVITKTGGTVIGINYKNGDSVKRGDIIVKLEDQEVESNYIKAKANYDSSLSDLKIKEISFAKFKQLRAEKYISEDEFLTQKGSYDNAKANLDTAKAAYLKAKEDYDDLTMVAKIDGIVTDLDEKMYRDVDANKTVFTVVDSKQMYIKTGVSVSEIFDTQLGNIAKLAIDGTDREYRGKVIEINPVANKDSKKYAVKILVDNQDQILKKGMYAKTIIDSGEKKAFVVPKSAIVVRDLFSYIFIEEKGIAQEIKVERGYAYEDLVEIKSTELKEGLNLVIDGQFLLMDKDKVNIIK